MFLAIEFRILKPRGNADLWQPYRHGQMDRRGLGSQWQDLRHTVGFHVSFGDR